jgi:Aspartyl protease
VTFLVAVTAALVLHAPPSHASAAPDIRLIRTVPGATVPRYVRLRYDVTAFGIAGTDEVLVDSLTGRFVERTNAGPAGGRQGFDGVRAWSSDATGLAEIADQSDDRSIILAWSYLLARVPRTAEHVARLPSPPRFSVQRIRFAGLTRAVDVRFDLSSGRVAGAELRAETNHQGLTVDQYRRFGNLIVPSRFRVHSDFGDTAEVLRTLDVPRVIPARAFAPPPPPDDTSLDGVTSVPFTLRRDGPVVTLRIDDGPPLQVLVDTGSSYTLTSSAARRSGLRVVGRGTTGGIGPSLVSVQFATAKRVRIGRAELHDQPMEIMLSRDLADRHGADGLIGYELFARFAARFDFTHRRLYLAHGAAALHPRGTRIPIVLESGQPQVNGAVDGLRGALTIDTGSAFGVDIMSPAVREHDLVRRYKATEIEVSPGIGGVLADVRARARTLRLGDVVVHDVPLALDLGTAGAMSDPSILGNVGMPVLKQFVIVLDYRGRAMYLDRVR